MILNKQIIKNIKEKIIYTISLLLAFFVIMFLFPYMTVISGSMTPTLRCKDFVVSTRFINKDNLKRKDIILFYNDKESFFKRNPIVKRIIGLPGETISIKKGVVYINNKALNEDYVNNKNTYFSVNNSEYMKEITIPKDCYFVLGDNRNNSIDSRYYGCIKKSQITKKPLFIYSKTENKIKNFF